MFDPGQLARWTGGRWSRVPGPIVAVAHDSREVGPGALFVALRGGARDGHLFVGDAFARGAAAAMVDAAGAGAWMAAGPLLVVPDTRRALAAMAAGRRAEWTGHVIGVGGSVGKTTAKELIADVLAAAGPVARTRGNWNNDIGLPMSMLAADPAARWGVFEIGINHPGEMAPLCRLLAPDWAVMMPVGPAHIEFFEDEAAIAREKAQLVRAVPPAGLAVLAADEPWFDVARSAARCRVATVAMDDGADYIGQRGDGDPALFGVRGSGGFRLACRLPTRGSAFARTALRAAAVGAEAGISPSTIAAAIERFRLPPMRGGERCLGGVLWLDDAYNANPMSVRAAAAALTEHPAPRKWLVLGGMRELGARAAELHRAVGRDLAGGPWAGLVVVGPLAAAIADGAVEAGWPPDRLWRRDDAASAATVLSEQLQPGDVVLIKASRGERIEDVMQAWAARTGAGG